MSARRAQASIPRAPGTGSPVSPDREPTDFARQRRTAVKVWLALLALLALTCASAFVPLGTWNTVVNLVIAAAKGLLVAAFFMHLRGGAPLLRIVAALALFTLALLFALSATDYANRRLHLAPYEAPRVLQGTELTPR